MLVEVSRYVYSIYTCFLVLEKDKYTLVLDTYNCYKQQQQKEKMKCIFCGTMLTMGIFIILGSLFVLSDATPSSNNDGKNNGGNLFPIGNQKSITGVNGDSKNDINFFLDELFSQIYGIEIKTIVVYLVKQLKAFATVDKKLEIFFFDIINFNSLFSNNF